MDASRTLFRSELGSLLARCGCIQTQSIPLGPGLPAPGPFLITAFEPYLAAGPGWSGPFGRTRSSNHCSNGRNLVAVPDRGRGGSIRSEHSRSRSVNVHALPRFVAGTRPANHDSFVGTTSMTMLGANCDELLKANDLVSRVREALVEAGSNSA